MFIKNIFSTISDNLITICLSISSFALPLIAPSWHGKILTILAVIWIFSTNYSRVKNVAKSNLFFIFAILTVILQLTGILISSNTKAAFAAVESVIPIFVLSMIIFTSSVHISTNVVRSVLISFLVGVITLNLASLAFISKDLWDPVNLQSNIIIANNSIVAIHPAYVSLYLSFSIFILMELFFPIKTKNRKKLGWVLFALIVSSVYLVWVNSRTGILSFFVGTTFFLLYKFKNGRRLIFFGSLLAVLILVLTLPFSSERFFKAPLRVATKDVSGEMTDPNIYTLASRRQILDCSIELLKRPEFFYGYGTGDGRDELRECYKKRGYNSLYRKGLDSHNEYFAQLHRHGLLGLIVFLGLLIIPLRHALKYKSALLAVFIVLFAMTAMFENVLSSQKGATFFALFCPLLMLFAQQNDPNS